MRRFLGEGAKKRVFEAHDTLLDRDVAVALIKAEGLDSLGRQRIIHEAQALGRLGSHPHIVSVFDLGEHEGQPYIVCELMAGDVEGAMRDAGEPLTEPMTIKNLIATMMHTLFDTGVRRPNVSFDKDGVIEFGEDPAPPPPPPPPAPDAPAAGG